MVLFLLGAQHPRTVPERSVGSFAAHWGPPQFAASSPPCGSAAAPAGAPGMWCPRAAPHKAAASLFGALLVESGKKTMSSHKPGRVCSGRGLFPAGLPPPSRGSKRFPARWDAERSLSASPEADVTGARARKFKVRRLPRYEQQGSFKEGKKKNELLVCASRIRCLPLELPKCPEPAALSPVPFFYQAGGPRGRWVGTQPAPLPNPTEEPGSALVQQLFGVFHMGRMGPAASGPLFSASNPSRCRSWRQEWICSFVSHEKLRSILLLLG